MKPEELAGKLVSWIREQVAQAKGRGVVVGMSGGLDSSVVAALAKRAFPHSVLGVILPCYSSQRDVEDAQKVAAHFGIPTVKISLDSVFDGFLEVLPEEGYGPATKRLAEANLKPRLRMIALYYLANRLGYLVLGTGNRSELSVGYFTKHGDGGVDLLPLGNLVKAQVRELAEDLGIPREILEKAPSAGLWEGQTDEGEMGLSYEELDRYLLSGEAREEVKRRVEALASASAHKRRAPAIPPF